MCLLPHACLQARKIAPGAIFEMLFVQFTLSALVQTSLFLGSHDGTVRLVYAQQRA